jgi:hypothetical protein
MGNGRDIARSLSPDSPHHDLLENMRDQLVIVLPKRLMDKDGLVRVPIEEVDGTGGSVVSFSVDHMAREFKFVVSRKQ